MRRFELKLLDELGYRLDLTATAGDGEAVVAGASYTFDPDEGLARTGERASDTVPVYRGEHLIAMAAGDFEGDMRLPARRLLRAALARHLGEVPLRSRELFRRHRPLRQASDTASDETAA